jgi:N-acetylglucosamine kinase-like BadF-type ATPase
MSTNPTIPIAGDDAARFVGIDIGGSKTHAIRGNRHGKVLTQAFAASANFETVSRELALAAIDVIFRGLGREPIDVICVGSAGINTPEQEQDLAAVIGEHAPGAHVLVAHDTRLILATAELDNGIAVIAGTGSVAWGRNAAGETARSGGWGYLLGDEGSGYVLVRDAIRAVLTRRDAGLPPDALAKALCDSVGVLEAYDLLAHFYAEPSRRYWAQKSVLVFDLAAAGDETCIRLIHDAATAIVTLIQAVAEHLGQPGPVALGGGLLVNQPALLTLVTAELRRIGIVDARPLTREPVHGALYLARTYQPASVR